MSLRALRRTTSHAFHRRRPYERAALNDANTHLQLQYAVSRVLLEASDIWLAAEAILRVTARAYGCEIAEFWGLTPDATALERQVSWHARSAAAAGFEAGSSGMRLGLEEGLAGRALARAEMSWSGDLHADPSFERQDLAVAAGLRSGLAIPISRPRGVICLFWTRPLHSAPPAAFLEAMSAIDRQIQLYMDRGQYQPLDVPAEYAARQGRDGPVGEGHAPSRPALAASDVVVCNLDRNMRVTWASSSSATYDAGVLVGTTPYDWLAAEEARRYCEGVRVVFETCDELQDSFEVSFQGNPRRVERILEPLIDATGDVKAVTVVAIYRQAEIASDRLRPGPSAPNHGSGRLDTAEFVQQVAALLQRVYEDERAPAATRRTIGEVIVDPANHGLRGPAAQVPLTRMEWRLLATLLEHAGDVMAHETLLDRVWGPEYRKETRLLHDTVSRLRHRLRASGHPTQAIHTIHGVGYRLQVA